MNRAKYPFLLAILLAVLAGGMSYSALNKKVAEITQGWQLRVILVAAIDLPEGTELSSEHLRVAEIPEKFVTDSVITPENKERILSHKITINLRAGDPLMWSHLQSSLGSFRLGNVVNKNFRAVTIKTSDTSAVGQFIHPNDQVDVVGIFQDPDTREQVSVTLLQNVLVIATGKISGNTKRNLLRSEELDYNHVTLMVLPEEAEILLLAQNLGALNLILRNPMDSTILEEKGRVSIRTLMTGERTTQLNKKRFEAIEIIRGNKSTKDIMR